jgi:hypothetical protein
MGQAKIFYSWQSDLPNSTNRGFIETAIEIAIKNLEGDDSIQLDPVIDRDTQGVPGSPDIATTIFEKIEEAQVFIGDVSIINGQNTSRPTPNPNVLVELGYAIKTLEMRRILLIMNTAYGELEQLPFDLRGRRVITYRESEDNTSRVEERKSLAGKIETGLRSILDKANLRAPLNAPLVEKEKEKAKAVKVSDRLVHLNSDTEKAVFDWLTTHLGPLNYSDVLDEPYDYYVDYEEGKRIAITIKNVKRQIVPSADESKAVVGRIVKDGEKLIASGKVKQYVGILVSRDDIGALGWSFYVDLMMSHLPRGVKLILGHVNADGQFVRVK